LREKAISLIMTTVPHTPLTEDLEEFLRAPRAAIIGSLRSDGSPSTVATWYLWLGDDRFMLSMEDGGFRARCLKRDERVSLTVLGEDWYEHVSIRGSVVELRADPDWADIDAISHHYRGIPYPRDAGYTPTTAIVEVVAWHEFRSTTRR
jgi:Pyridoxamine 5'-phosphate oxidase